jgi:hypothetical protein
MTKLILRVDDCGWTPDKADDRNLEYFLSWRAALALPVDAHVTYGFIPVTLGFRELGRLEDELGPNERLAVHGWDHADGAVVTAKQMRYGLRLLYTLTLDRLVDYAPAYIPPFNRYDHQTIRDWREQTYSSFRGSLNCHSVFFGGFTDSAVGLNLSSDPIMAVPGLLHLPAEKELYGRAAELLDRLPRWLEKDHPDSAPAVVTLHATWDCNDFLSLAELGKLLAPLLVSPDDALQYLVHRGRVGGRV